MGFLLASLTHYSRACQEADEPALSDDEGGAEGQMFVWGTNVDVDKAKRKFRAFFTSFELEGNEGAPLAHYLQKLADIAQTEDYSLNLDCSHLHSFDPGLYKLMVRYPRELIPIFDVELNEYFAKHYLDEDQESFPQIQVRHTHSCLQPAARSKPLTHDPLSCVSCARST